MLEDLQNRRILVVDDNRNIHEDFSRILASETGSGLEEFAAALFGEGGALGGGQPSYELEHAFQGEQALELVQRARDEERPFAVAFVDVRMPPGWDGVVTTQALWAAAPDLQVVLCTAYSDYSWEEMSRRLGAVENLLILKKPFDTIEVRQLALSLTTKWELARRACARLEELEARVAARTAELTASHNALIQEAAERVRMEIELRHAQKLEAVGQLAAGVAHEINTPVQFIGDSVYFLKGTFRDLRGVIEGYRALLGGVEPAELREELVERGQALEDGADLVFLLEESASAFEMTRDGVSRVSSIVAALKQFAHPQRGEASPVDINQALETTLVVARGEYKYLADVEKDLGEIPLIQGYPGDLNQVFLNLLINACHAIEDGRPDPEVRGLIRVRTWREEERVCVEIRDSGAGIAEDIQGRIFEPFFTTKEVGRGTGQGLAIAHAIVVDKHGGRIRIDSEVGRGTAFTIDLPIRGADRAAA